MTIQPPSDSTYRLNWRRYLRIITFFVRIVIETFWWYLIVQRIIGRDWVKRGESKRFRRWAQRFRAICIQLGGVMIKLGQFASARVDVMPPEIIEELIGLQDEVPPIPFKRMNQTLREELGPDWRQHFSAFNETAVAAASLGQAYRAQLQESGDKVVVKVLRPSIENTVYTDLSALEIVARMAMRFRFIARRADVPLLLEEFARVLWEELDYTKEAANADRFAKLFADDMGVYIPSIYHQLSTQRVLVLEDVTAIKLNDYAAIEAAGIDRRAVAQRLLDVYLRQVFVYRFFHADPHPGNIFVYPLPVDETRRRSDSGQRPFYLVFIDFGMTGQLTPELSAGLREALVALITRDSKRLVQSYTRLGVLLPGADLKRLEDANRAVFDQVWGLDMNALTQMDFQVVNDIIHDFTDLLFSMPFQVPQNFVYLGRAVGILVGMCTGLDPAFDPWSAVEPFAREFLQADNEAETDRLREWLKLLDWNTLQSLLTPQTLNLVMEAGRDTLTRTATLPTKTDNVLSILERGELGIQMHADNDLNLQLTRLERTGGQIANGLIFGSLLLTSTLLYLNGETDLGTGGYVLSGLTLMLGWLRGRA